MKVCINLLDDKRNIGPVIFSKRLAIELENQRVKIVDRKQRHDILLAIIRDANIEDSRKKGAKIVQRLDGIYHHLDQDYQIMNRGIEGTYNEVDSVIFQSWFNKKMVKKYFGEREGLDFVIPNGVDSKEFVQVGGTKNKKIFLCSAKWRPDKRLDSLFRGFVYSNLSNSELWVLGETDKRVNNERIKYFGEIHSDETPEFYNNADFFIHLAYDDNCPNSVVEALVTGLPVICTNNGGTKELVQNSGEIIWEREYDMELYYPKDIPKVGKENVRKSLLECLEKEGSYPFPREDLYIENIAKKYKQAFEEVLDSK